MAEKSLTSLTLAEVDFFKAPYTGWYRIYMATGRPLLRIQRHAYEPHEGMECAWVATVQEPIGFGAATAAIAAREIVSADSAGNYSAVAVPFASLTAVDVWLGEKDRFSASVVLGQISYMGENRPYQQQFADR